MQLRSATEKDYLERARTYFKKMEQWLDKNDTRYASTWKAYLVQVDSYMRDKWIPFLLEKMIPEVVVEEEEW